MGRWWLPTTVLVSDRRAATLGILAGLAAGALWGLVFVAPRMAPSLSSSDIIGVRYITYGLAAGLWLWWGHLRGTLRWPTWPQARAAAGLSLLGNTGYYLFLVWGIRDAGTEVPTLIIGSIPLWMMLLGKPHGLRWWALAPGLVCTMAGLWLMMRAAQGDAPLSLGDGVFWRGVGWAVAAMASWTAFGLLNSAWLRRHPEVSATEWANWVGVATGLGALALWVGNGSPVSVLLQTRDGGLGLAVCVASGLGSAWLASILWNIASQKLSASLCGQLIVSETLFSLLYSFLWNGQWPSAAQWWAGLLFVAGMSASIRAHR